MDIVSKLRTKISDQSEHWDIIAYVSIELLLSLKIKNTDPDKTIESVIIENALEKIFKNRPYSYVVNVMELWQNTYDKSGDAFYNIQVITKS